LLAFTECRYDHLIDVSPCSAHSLPPVYPCTPTFGYQSFAVG
jgi:hypothetical protein